MMTVNQSDKNETRVDPMIRAKRLRDRLDAYNKNHDEFPRVTLALCIELFEARQDHANLQAFGVWLVENELDDLDKNDRAAGIKMGEHPEITRIVLHETKLRWLRRIWEEEVEPRVRDLSKTTADPLPAPQLSAHSATTPEIEIPAPEKVRSEVRSKPASLLTQRSGFYNAPRSQEIAALFRHEKAQNMLSCIWQGRSGKQIWKLLTTALDAGLVTENDNSFKTPTLRLLFSLAPPLGYSRQFNLSNPKQRARVETSVLPAMIACRDELMADPENIERIIGRYENEQRAKQRAAVVAEKRSIAVAALPSREQELVMFGQTVWPRIDNKQGEYDYDQVRAAIWTFRDYESWNQMAKESTGSLGLRIRNSLRYLGDYLQRTDRDNRMSRIFSLMIWFSHLMEMNPTAECKWPPYPHIEGQW